MAAPIVIIGPPGTGKTELGRVLTQKTVESGVAPEEIAYMAFTKAAAHAGAERCGIDIEDRELWFRTLHSACYRLIAASPSSRPPVMTAKHRRAFAQEFGLDLSPEDRETKAAEESVEALYWEMYRLTGSKAVQHDADQFLRLYHLSRLYCRTPAELEEVKKSQHPKTVERGLAVVDDAPYQKFVEVYEGYKNREGVIDFIDMAAWVLQGRCLASPPAWKLAVIDEAQDLCPLLWAVAERTLFQAERTFLIGDDHQAIFQFAGASAEDFLRYRTPGNVWVLQQTHRFGSAIVDLAAQISERIMVKHPRHVIPKPGVEHRVRMECGFDPEAFEAALNERGHQTGAILHRHIAGCREVGARFIQAGIPFINERGPNPLAKTEDRSGYLAFLRLAERKRICYGDVLALLNVVPSRKLVNGQTVTLVEHGAKKATREETGTADLNVMYEPEDLAQIFSETFLSAAAARDPRWLDVDHREYYDALIKRGFDLERGQPKIVVTTIHGFKGREADQVALFSEMFPKLAGDENEHRVAYVGATRTRHDLAIVGERVVADWTREYPYPMG